MDGAMTNRRNIEIAHDGVKVDRPLSKCFAMAEGDIWIPKSQIINEGENTVTIPEWLAVQKGLV